MTAPTLPPAAADPIPAAPARAARLMGVARGLGDRLHRDTAPPPWLMGVLGALWAAGIGLAVAVVPMLLAWMATPDSGLTWAEALRLGGLLWVVAHGAPVTIAGLTLTLLPWGLAVIPLLLLGYAGGWSARRAAVSEPADVMRLVLAGVTTYVLVVGVVAAATARPTSSAALLLGVGGAAVLAGAGLTWGAMRAAGVTVPMPTGVATCLRAGLVGAATLMGLGAVAATLSLLLHLDDAITMAQALGAGAGGGLALMALGIAYVPVLAVWGTAYVMGAGVVIAPAITVSPFIATTPPTQLPPFPLLAALPQGASALSWLLPLTGVLAGVLAGMVIARRARQEARLVRLAMAGGAAMVAGIALALAAQLASGSLGDLRLAHLGPMPLTVGVLGAVLVVLGAAPSAIVPASPERPRLAVANVPPVGSSADSVDPDHT